MVSIQEQTKMITNQIVKRRKLNKFYSINFQQLSVPKTLQFPQKLCLFEKNIYILLIIYFLNKLTILASYEQHNLYKDINFFRQRQSQQYALTVHLIQLSQKNIIRDLIIFVPINKQFIFYQLTKQTKSVSKMKNRYSRINSFTQKPSIPQISAYILFSLEVITFYAIVQRRIINMMAFICLHIFFALFLALQVFSSLMVSIIDPSDTLMIRYKNEELQQSDKLDDKIFCDQCASYVNNSSKHCRSCNRCVSNFDHHCRWVNNCIGLKNYRIFVVMIIVTFMMVVTYISGVIVILVEDSWQQFIGQIITVCMIGSLLSLFGLTILLLIIFHIYLGCQNLTSYEFIHQFYKTKRITNSCLEEQKNTEEKINKLPSSSTSKLVVKQFVEQNKIERKYQNTSINIVFQYLQTKNSNNIRSLSESSKKSQQDGNQQVQDKYKTRTTVNIEDCNTFHSIQEQKNPSKRMINSEYYSNNKSRQYIKQKIRTSVKLQNSIQNGIQDEKSYKTNQQK